MSAPRTLPVRLALLGVAVASSATLHAQLAATVRQHTGELRLTNVGVTDFNLTGYTIDFPTEELRADNWLTVSGRLDASPTGDGSFDMEMAWQIFSGEPPPPTANDLTEGVFLSSGGLMLPGESLYIGSVWDPQSSMDVTVTVAELDDGVSEAAVTYIPPGDYNEDGTVDALDYTKWKDEFGMTGIGLLADGNADEVVNLADYSVWRDNLGATAVQGSIGSLASTSGLAIPEPSSLVLLISGVAIGAAGLHSRYWAA